MKKSIKTNKITDMEHIPELICTRMPTKGSNNGEYSVSIPLKYMIVAYAKPTAFFVFKFKGLHYAE